MAYNSRYNEFDDFASGGSGNSTSDPQTLRLLEDVEDNVRLFSDNVNIIEEKVKQLKDRHDTQLKDEIVQLVADTAQLAKITNGPIKRLRLQSQKLSTADKGKFERLMTTFSGAGIRFKNLQKVTSKLEKDMIDQSRQAKQRSLSQTESDPGNPFGSGQEGSPILNRDGFANEYNDRVLQEQIEAEAGLLEERESHMRQLETDILDINDIFRDLGTMVHEQGDMIDNIEANVEIASDRVNKGNSQLKKAVGFKKCSRKLTLAIIIIITIVVIVIIIAILILLGALGVFKNN